MLWVSPITWFSVSQESNQDCRFLIFINWIVIMGGGELLTLEWNLLAIEEKNKQPFPWEPTRFPCSDQKSLEVVWGGSMPVPFHAGSTGTSSCLISWGSINNICQGSLENRKCRNKQAVLTPKMIHYSWSVLTSLQEKTGDGNRQEWGDDTCTSELT